MLFDYGGSLAWILNNCSLIVPNFYKNCIRRKTIYYGKKRGAKHLKNVLASKKNHLQGEIRSRSGNGSPSERRGKLFAPLEGKSCCGRIMFLSVNYCFHENIKYPVPDGRRKVKPTMFEGGERMKYCVHTVPGTPQHLKVETRKGRRRMVEEGG